MGYSREYVEALEAGAIQVIEEPQDDGGDEFVTLADSEFFNTPMVEEVEADDQYIFQDFEPGTFVVLAPEVFEPVASLAQQNAIFQYAYETGHEVWFQYRGAQRRVRVYERTNTSEIGYDTEANDGRGGYRTFRRDKIINARLARPSA